MGVRTQVMQTPGQVRFNIVKAAAWGVTNAWQIHYPPNDVRPGPMPLKEYKNHELPLMIDCSEYATCCYYAAGAEDPNGLGYNGFGFTGTMLDHLPSIPLSKAKPGDLVVFTNARFPRGQHVVIITGWGGDPMCASQGGESDPKFAPLSNFQGIGPMTVLRGVPLLPPVKRRVHTAKWRVVGDKGTVVSLVHRTRLGWYLRHLRLARRQKEQLAFHRIHKNERADRQPRPPA
jgi:hypothetical protein